MSFANVKEAGLLELVENLAMFKETQQRHQLVYSELLLGINRVFVYHLKSEGLTHVLFGVKSIRVL